MARCSADEVEFGYRLLNRELGLVVPVSRPGAFIPKFAAALEAPENVRERANELVTLAEDAGHATDRHPGGLAAACLYQAGYELGRFYTQAQLAEVVDVTPPTIRGRLNELLELVG